MASTTLSQRGLTAERSRSPFQLISDCYIALLELVFPQKVGEQASISRTVYRYFEISSAIANLGNKITKKPIHADMGIATRIDNQISLNNNQLPLIIVKPVKMIDQG